MTDGAGQNGFQLLIQVIQLDETHASPAVTEPALGSQDQLRSVHDDNDASEEPSPHDMVDVRRAKRCATDDETRPAKRRKEHRRSKRGGEDKRSKRGKEDKRSKRGKEDKRSKRGKEDRRSKRGKENKRNKRHKQHEDGGFKKEDKKSKHRRRRLAHFQRRWERENPFADEFREDWVLPNGPNGTPPRIMASPRRVPDPLDDHPPRPKPGGLYRLSTEVRLVIFRELLVTHEPILVYGGWRLVYRRPATRTRPGHDGPRLSTAIMRTCKLFFAEAQTVLYGDNLFRYILHALCGYRRSRTLYRNDADYADGYSRLWGCRQYCACFALPDQMSKKAARARAKKTTVECDINVERYRHLFRRIAVEAQEDHYSATTMKAMVNALQTFVNRPLSRQPLNLHTLFVRVAPRQRPPLFMSGDLDDSGNGATTPRFTFVDFFAPESSVLAAIKQVWCGFLHVDLMVNHMEGSVHRQGHRMTLDRRLEMHDNRVSNSTADVWVGDKVMQKTRKATAAADRKKLEKIGERVLAFCNTTLTTG
ncbi:hypothetical protein CP533_2673 [Ophiocordyceps camponoti-saundersi (nom. inval.)]|nr:hypothetical protein CP533_2673 [Ophiocordyceps camponoti-saundersi (nom. inval.)]